MTAFGSFNSNTGKRVVHYPSQSAERGSVHDEKQGTKNGAMGNATRGGTQGRKSVITSDTEGAR